MTGPTPKGPLELHGSRGQQRDGAQGAGALVAAHGEGARPGRGLRHDRKAGSLPRHGHGVFTGDECLAGSPTQGTELCAVVEYAYSLELLLSILGDAGVRRPPGKDRFQRAARDLLARYVGAPVRSAGQPGRMQHPAGRTWNTNGPEANIFGVEPNYGCCTANLSQGWPKFAAHCGCDPQDGGLAAVAYAPSAGRDEIERRSRSPSSWKPTILSVRHCISP